MSFEIEEPVTPDNFCEEAYRLANPDVAAAVVAGQFESGHHHFQVCGHLEGRKQVRLARLRTAKRDKLSRLVAIVRDDLPHDTTEFLVNFLTPQLAAEYRIVPTDNVSAHPYGDEVIEMIARYPNGLILDCGAGKRGTYYDNVINLEVVNYLSTDVRAVAEELPFRDGCFDAAISVAVLEHVKDPFRAAKELSRVVRPGGELFCAVPFLQPLHGYPHHYYNMTHQGLKNLFEGAFEIVRQSVPRSVLPIWALNWILNSWAAGLDDEVRETFLALTVRDLAGDAHNHLDMPYVQNLSADKNMELASATILRAIKLR